jgi:hypothetical protein
MGLQYGDMILWMFAISSSLFPHGGDTFGQKCGLHAVSLDHQSPRQVTPGQFVLSFPWSCIRYFVAPAVSQAPFQVLTVGSLAARTPPLVDLTLWWDDKYPPTMIISGLRREGICRMLYRV